MVFCTIQGKKGTNQQAGQQDTPRGKRVGRNASILELNSFHRDASTHKFSRM